MFLFSGSFFFGTSRDRFTNFYKGSMNIYPKTETFIVWVENLLPFHLYEFDFFIFSTMLFKTMVNSMTNLDPWMIFFLQLFSTQTMFQDFAFFLYRIEKNIQTVALWKKLNCRESVPSARSRFSRCTHPLPFVQLLLHSFFFVFVRLCLGDRSRITVGGEKIAFI